MTSPLLQPQPVPHAGTLRTLILFRFLITGIISTGLVGPSRSAIEHEYGLSHFVFGLTLAIIQIGAAGSVLLSSFRLRRFNFAHVLLVSLTLEAIGFFCIWRGGHVPMLVLGWTLITLGVVIGAMFNKVAMELWPIAPRMGLMLLHAFNGL